MEWKVDQNEGNYILRYYLPCEPIYSGDVTERRAGELIDYCLENGISAVMLYVDLNPYWYYMPDDTKHTEYYVPIIEKLALKLRENHISYQLNYQNLFGSWDGGADLRYVNEWENFVADTGAESYGCACGIGKKFRKIAGEKLTLWSKTKPDVVWIDDDIRFHNHRAIVHDFWAGKTHKEQLDFGCFCDAHIALFNEKYGLHCDREQVVDGITNGNELRAKWLEFSGECADELTSWIEKTVHAVSPDTRVAVMTSNPDVHAVEGRNWDSFLRNLSNPHKPLIRPTFGPYKESTPLSFVQSYALVEQMKANIASQYGTDVDFCPEIENTRFTRWSKSMAATGYQIMLSAFLGCKSVTLSLFDLDGCVMGEQPEFAELLREKRPFINRLAKENLWEQKGDGIGLLTAPDRVPMTANKVSAMEGLAAGRFLDDILIAAGIPCTYVTPDRIEDVCACALDGFTSRIVTDSELMKILSKGVLLTSGAAKELCDRGFGEYIGLTVGDRVHCIAGCEQYHTTTHRDNSIVREPSRIEGFRWRELVLCGARPLSELVTPYGQSYPGFTAYENKLGGKVYVYAAESSAGDGFYSNYRIRLLKNICKKMHGSLLEVNNHSYSLTAVKNGLNTQSVFIANYSADRWCDVVITAPRKVKNAVVINADGTEHTPEISGSTIICKSSDLHMYGALFCKIEYEPENKS